MTTEEEVNKRKRPVIVIDGLNCFIRHFMVNEAVSGYSDPIGGVVGFLRFLDFMLARFAPGKVVVVWENGGASPRRRHICPTYKESSGKFLKNIKDSAAADKSTKGMLKGDTENKVKQLSLLYKLLKKTPVHQIFIKDTECDDIIGYLIKYEFARENRLKLIISSDKDFYQLLGDPDIKIYDPARKVTVDENYVLEKFGITPNNFCLARTMQGDPSDNIEGVPGIGFKTIVKRFQGFADASVDLTIDQVLDQCRTLTEGVKKPSKGLQTILQCESIMRRNWKLMYLTSSNLSASQIEKVQGTLGEQTGVGAFDRLGLIKEVAKAGMNISFDFDRFSSNIRQCLIFE